MRSIHVIAACVAFNASWCMQADEPRPVAPQCDDGDRCTKDVIEDGQCEHVFVCETPLGS